MKTIIFSTAALAIFISMPNKVWAWSYTPPRCKPLEIRLNGPSVIDVSEKQIGDSIMQLDQERVGTCDFTNGMGDDRPSKIGWIYLLTVSKDSGYDSKKLVYVKDASDVMWMGTGSDIVYANAGNLDINVMTKAKPQIILNKKLAPGLTQIDLATIYNGVRTAGVGGYHHARKDETNAVISFQNQMVNLIYRPSCSAKVNDVAFGIQTVDSIKKGTVEKEASIEVSCEAILPNYSITLNSSKGIKDAKKGIINSAHNNIGYQLNWGKGDGSEVSSSGTAVTLGEQLEPATKPNKNNFTLPLKVKPVILNNMQGVTSGNADSDVTITLEFK